MVVTMCLHATFGYHRVCNGYSTSPTAASFRPQTRRPTCTSRVNRTIPRKFPRDQRLAALHNENPQQGAKDPREIRVELSKRYNVMLLLIVRFLALPSKQQLHDFLRSKPEAVSVPFISWLAEQEANAVGEQKRTLAAICEELVMFREQLEEQRMDQLYVDTLAALTEGEADPTAAALALAASPEQYASQLALRLTGSSVVSEGYDPVYDVLVKVVPPAALTPEGVAKGHERARELAVDLRARRKRSVQSMIGRAQLTPEQADKLMAGSNASRILDMLLTLPSTADRLVCLPDCFTPPGEGEEGEGRPATAAAAGTSDDRTITGEVPSGMSMPSPTSDSEDLVWCTPSQLLVELDARLQRLDGKGAGADETVLGVPGGQLTGEELLGEMRLLREEVWRTWLQKLDVN